MALVHEDDIPIFFQFLGGAVFLAVGQNIFVNRLVSSLHEYAPSLDSSTVVGAGAKGLRFVVNVMDPEALPGAVMAYNTAITDTFYAAAATTSLTFFYAFFVEWKSVKGKMTNQK